MSEIPSAPWLDPERVATPRVLIRLGSLALEATYQNTVLQMYEGQQWKQLFHIRVETDDQAHYIFDHHAYGSLLLELIRRHYPRRLDAYPSDEVFAAYVEWGMKCIEYDPPF